MQAAVPVRPSETASWGQGRLLEKLAHQLAENHTVAPVPDQKTLLLEHLQTWTETLLEAYQRFRVSPARDVEFSIASEWMLDNFYIVEQTLRQIQEDLPLPYYRQLPKLDATAMQGYPRVFAVAWELTAYSRSQLDLARITAFVKSYQEVTPLTIGELWALPIMLRMGIIESLAAAVAAITGIGVVDNLDMLPILPLAAKLPDETVVAHCFLSLRLLATCDWKAFFADISRVEQILNRDPLGVYARMDFETRNSYCKVIEELARHSNRSEETVAEDAVELARLAQTQADSVAQDNHQPIPIPTLERITHVGFYLIDQGRTQLEARVGYRPNLRLRLRRWCLAHPTLTYVGSVLLLSVLILIGLLEYAVEAGDTLPQIIGVGVLGFPPALAVAIGVINWIVTHSLPPRTLPRMDFTEGIPAECRTMVVIPTLLSSPADVDALLQDLELHYLRNSDPQLTFALLSDFVDAPTQHMPEDGPLLERAKAGIEALNRKYAQTAPFYLFHRERLWNDSEGVWMGWERKRGKLHEFNCLLMAAGETSYSVQLGNLSLLQDVKYVITLDTDTALPQGAADRLIATLAHPLNRPQFAADGRSIVAGYSVLQPRVEIKPISANRSRFAQIFAGSAGLDLYTLAVSDVYQDLFGEGIYVGKGIYDVAAFETNLAGQTTPNTLLSHDLFEGIYGRAALVTDVILYEDYPSRYLAYTSRLRRWIRGDWQLLPWLFPKVHTAQGTAPNPLLFIDRWKIFDNLRRSLLAPCLLFLLAAVWLGLPGSPLVWTILIILTPAIPIATQTILRAGRNIGWQSLGESIQAVRIQVMRWALAVAFLPYEALISLHAIGITLVRVLITRKHMLQWTTSAHTARRFSMFARYATWQSMSPALLFVAILAFAIVVINPHALVAACPLLILWLVAPQVAYWISQPFVRVPLSLSDEQRSQLRGIARRTWAFFEHFVGPDDHWLPPDHFQEAPRGITAHHTSPTNIGLLLLSTLSAYDLGYTTLLELALGLRSTFENMDKLERYRGHFLNWYDTQTLEPLLPRYLSTVDSGNLAACLIALKEGCLALTHTPLASEQQWQGVLDLLVILTDMLKDLGGKEPDPAIAAFQSELDTIRDRIMPIQNRPDQWGVTLTWLSKDAWEKISRRLMELLESHLSNLNAESLSRLHFYLERLRRHMLGIQQNIDLLVPWLNVINEPPSLFTQPESALSQAWQDFSQTLLAEMPRLGEAVARYDGMIAHLRQLQEQLTNSSGTDEQVQEAQAWCQKLNDDLASARLNVQTLVIGYRDLADQAEAYVHVMDFKFLFDEHRQVFHIGYNATTEKLDANYYDLLASEARVASLVAIAKGDIPPSHWLHLGRPITKVNGEQVLLSWSGTMFEYLMPALIVRNYEGTFLADSCYGAVDAQISYGKQKHVPWGISESGFYAFDANMNYQYRAFGVPQLGFKRELAEDLVVAPYASLIALPLDPQAVLSNIAHLNDLNMLGHYGYYEAIDYTPDHLQAGQEYGVVQSYMAHHQGMILLTLGNYLTGSTMVSRFHADSRIQSTELLLQEKIPHDAPLEYPHQDEGIAFSPVTPPVSIVPWRVPADSPIPQVHFLSQGRYGVLVTNAGGGYSQWQDIALTRWQADSTLDNWGTWLYVQDRENGVFWSATSQPTGASPDKQEIIYHPHKVEYRRWSNGISTHTEIAVGSDDIELRRVTLLNDSDQPRRLKIISYAEIVLAPPAADQRHPAFNKLFIESEFVPNANTLLFHRRARSAQEKPLYLAHALVVESGSEVTGEYESDRARFLGRGHTPRAPHALQGGKLSGTVGATLDPIMSIGQAIDLAPHAKVEVIYLTLVAPSRQEALAMVRRYQSQVVVNRAFDEARVRSEMELRTLGLNASGVEHIQELLSVLLYPSDALRASAETLAKNQKGQSGLWAYGISGDYPILLIGIRNADTSLLREALQAYIYWHSRQIKINLVILNYQDTGYALDLQNQVYRQINQMEIDDQLNKRDGIFLLRADQIPEVDKVLLETVAGAILDDSKGSLTEQLARLSEQLPRLPAFTPTLVGAEDTEPTPPLARPTDLLMDNGLGGFSPDGREYVIYLQPDQWTPRPWINVIANPQFGFFVSEAGSGCTWAENSGENRLTPWRNDPISDTPSEALYLRDEETASIWSPTPLPIRASTPYLIRHGAGYSTFENQSHGLNQQVRMFVAPDAPIKIVQLRLHNLWSRPRRITVTYYAEWVLGTTHDAMQPYIVPEFESDHHALLAHNHYNIEFAARVAFLAANKRPHGLTADRSEFLGPRRSINNPAALKRVGLGSTVRAGLDPCAAIQLHVDLPPGEAETVYFLIGQGADREETLALIQQYQNSAQVEAAWQATTALWDSILNCITVQTPDAAMNLMLNRWLLYQTLSCRVWGRSALYQSSGAFGYRDQLQDVMALLHARPDLAREQILLAARHQFEAGDVLHWWHPPSGRGVRTRFSDDLLWLPFVTAHYVATTGDSAILHEQVPFLRGDALRPEEEERYGQYEPTAEVYPLYEHCRRAVEKGSTAGTHGLPLFGSGDWNDGMNRVGIEGRGESVWVGWFLHATLMGFSALWEELGNDPEAYRQQAQRLSQALETSAWDGDWYKRAYFDDGWPMGSRENRECQIDSIAQSWAVLSGAADPARAAQAMEAVNERLVRREDQLILLFAPPFDKSLRDPGYIKGYLPGIRENGGQYTHGATWVAWAFAALGMGDRAEELYRLLNPIYHADTPQKMARFQAEPYVVPADVYSVPPHTGYAGWTWYTGSAGWMYRLGVEAILGVCRMGNVLQINPCIPTHWPGFEFTYRVGMAHYHICVENPDRVSRGVRQITLDGEVLPGSSIPLSNDPSITVQRHDVHVVLGSTPDEGA